MPRITGELTTEQQLDIISRAWGRSKGYCFFPWVDGGAEDMRQRNLSYQEGPAFRWPRDRLKIIHHLNNHKKDDIWWCPSLFEYKRRQQDVAVDESALWADLDEVDPRDIDEQYRPSIAWETSPGRYQALWILRGTLRNASIAGNENQRLTYYLGADRSGWDTTQLLRIPGWHNHKPDRREQNGGTPPKGKLLFYTTLRYGQNIFKELPEVEGAKFAEELVGAELEVAEENRDKIMAQIKLKLKPYIRDYFRARDTGAADRSEVLWQMERELADLGLSVAQIVALVRPTVWNKYEHRADEIKRLTLEATKAIAMRGEHVVEEEPEERTGKLQRIEVALEQVKDPVWLIQDIWTDGACGFISGQPKSYKSWFGLDMALSIATGDPFLEYFDVAKKGHVLYIQEEDSLPRLKARYWKIMNPRGNFKERAHQVPGGNGQTDLIISPKEPRKRDPDVDILVREGFIISDPGWMEWLDRQLEEKPEGYRALILDPLMMMVGEVKDEAGPMTEHIFRPLKQLSEKYGIAIVVVNHMRKNAGEATRGGQMMLGSVANHAWSENSLFLTHDHGIHVEVESKDAQGGEFTVGRLKNRSWTPSVTKVKLNVEDEPEEQVEVHRASEKRPKVVTAMEADGRTLFSAGDIQHLLKLSVPSSAYRQLQRAEERGYITKDGHHWRLTHQ